ncbi:class I adenylate-forming enzyme family protein [Plantactinospora sp. GCM10030261]|uniref:class I adenylate-forming enzyme family protein n=1 Tax=Plantactinospora sp. GCM10030261 TaxID=3273420 RepID=UPI00360A038B
MSDDETTSITPLAARRAFMTEPDLGAGNFLQYALDANPHRAVPFVFSHHTDHRGQVVLRGHSLNDLARTRDRYARWYWSTGVRPGEPVGVVIAEGLEPLLHFLALTALGAIPAMVNDAMRPDVMLRYLDHVGVVGVVADDTTRLAAAYRSAPHRRPRFLALTAEVQAFDADTARLPERYPHQHDPADVVALIHSSGTTGTPKSTMLGHRQFWDGKQPRMVRFPAEPYDRLMSLMPHTHAGGLSYFLTAVLLGLPVVVMADWRRPVVEPVMEAFQPTMVASFPRTFVELATGDLPVKGAARVHSWFNTGDAAHHGHIRRLVQLGERPAGLIKPWLLPSEAAAESALPGSQFVDGLGSSEMGMALFGGITTPETPRNDRCVGKPLEVVTRAAVLDPTGGEVPDGTVGMLAVQTPSRTPGYWHDPRLTSSFELNGYWLTGDVARREADGTFYHLDRTVDVIDTLDGPVYSLPVEEILLADCAEVVRDCSVLGIPGPDGGQLPVAVVQLQAEATGWSATEILDLANRELTRAGLASLAAVRIAETPADFPLGPTGKVLKRELRARLATLLTGPPSNPDEATATDAAGPAAVASARGTAGVAGSASDADDADGRVETPLAAAGTA